MPFAEDLDIFFSNDGHGSAFIYIPDIGARIQAVGIFDNAYFGAGDEIQVSGSQPRITYPSAKITPAPLYGEKLIHDNNHYTIVGIEPDGTGVTTLLLEKDDNEAC
jgi:hypothetical protein